MLRWGGVPRKRSGAHDEVMSATTKPSRRSYATLRYVIASAFIVLCLALRPLTSDRDSHRDRDPLTQVAIHVADDILSWLGGTAVAALIAFSLIDRWNARVERERRAREETARTHRIRRFTLLILADLRHGLKLIVAAILEVEPSIKEECFPVRHPVEVGDVPQAMRSIKVDLGRAEEFAVVASRVISQMGHGKGPAGLARIRRARDQLERLEEGVAGCFSAIRELDDLSSQRPIELLTAAALLERTARLWRQETHSRTAESMLEGNDSAEGSHWAADTNATLWRLIAQLLKEVTFLYDEAAQLHDSYRLSGFDEGA